MTCADEWDNNNGVKMDVSCIALLLLNRIYEIPSWCFLESLK